jgi:hypothetical protein
MNTPSREILTYAAYLCNAVIYELPPERSPGGSGLAEKALQTFSAKQLHCASRVHARSVKGIFVENKGFRRKYPTLFTPAGVNSARLYA